MSSELDKVLNGDLDKFVEAELQLKKIRTGNDVTVKEAVNLLASIVYGNIRQMSMIPSISHFIVGGKDEDGFHLYDLSPDGSIIETDEYVSSGSGSVMAYGVLETLYKKDMSVDEALKVGIKSVNAAVQRDIASGNGIDIFTITKEGVKKVLTREIEYKLEI